MSTHRRIDLGLEYEYHLDVRQVDDLENAVGGRGGFIARLDVGEVYREELMHSLASNLLGYALSKFKAQ